MPTPAQCAAACPPSVPFCPLLYKQTEQAASGGSSGESAAKKAKQQQQQQSKGSGGARRPLAVVGDAQLSASRPAIVRELYTEHPELSALSDQEVAQLMEQRRTAVDGSSLRPVMSFEQTGLPADMLHATRDFMQPSPIQSQVGGGGVAAAVVCVCVEVEEGLWPVSASMFLPASIYAQQVQQPQQR